MSICACGCGGEARRTWIHGHDKRKEFCVRGHLLADTSKQRLRSDGKWERFCTSCARINCRKAERRLRYESYGGSLSKITELEQKQQDECAICGNPNPHRGGTLVVDHSHGLGKVRGLLCDPCNTGLGMFRDDPERLTKALEYLSRTSW